MKGYFPDAGDARSATSAHRDRTFENLYLVLTGAKTFRLLPPSAAAYLTTTRCVAARWTKTGNGAWALRDDEPRATVDWLDVDLGRDLADDDGAPLPAPAVATLRAGDLLYLPAGWIHEVEQHDDTLALNWWFPARLDDSRWALHELARHVGELRSGTTGAL